MKEKRFKNMKEVEEKNKSMGNYWFSDGAIDFFKSKIETELIDGRYFISSEKQRRQERKYTIREVSKEGRIKTVGEYRQFNTKEEAKEELDRIIKERD